MTKHPNDSKDADASGAQSMSAADLYKRADWQALAEFTIEHCAQEQDKAQAAAYAACANLNLGKYDNARALMNIALEWGCARENLARMLFGAVHLTLGRAAAIGELSAQSDKHFIAALSEPNSDASDIERHEIKFKELVRLGLLTDAASSIKRTLADTPAYASFRRQKSKLNILNTELDVLQHELSIALKRGQIMSADGVQTAETNLAKQSVSQLGQDIWALERANNKRDGFFVEFGATDGVALSNTYLLETAYGWRGLLAEPNPRFIDALKTNRTCIVSDACIGPITGEEVEFIFADVYGGMARHAESDQHAENRRAYHHTGNVERLKTISLHDFLERHNAPKDIDYISVDTEGSEYEILKEFPFDKWNVRCWTIEHNYTPIREKILALMNAHGYKRTEAKWDDWYYR